MIDTSRIPSAQAGGPVLRAMQETDLAAAHALSQAQRWPHRLVDWQQAFRLGEGQVAEWDGRVVGVALRWLWGEQGASVGLILVAEPWRGLPIGRHLVSALLHGLDDRTVLLHATPQGRRLFQRLGFEPAGEVRQHQGKARPAPLMALRPGWRLRPPSRSDLDLLVALDAAARGMQRRRLVEDWLDGASAVVLDQDGRTRGFAVLRRFGKGLLIGPVVAPDELGAKAMIAHLAGLNAGKFVRIDVNADAGLGAWLDGLGLLGVDTVTAMVRGRSLPASADSCTYALATQSLG